MPQSGELTSHQDPELRISGSRGAHSTTKHHQETPTTHCNALPKTARWKPYDKSVPAAYTATTAAANSHARLFVQV